MNDLIARIIAATVMASPLLITTTLYLASTTSSAEQRLIYITLSVATIMGLVAMIALSRLIKAMRKQQDLIFQLKRQVEKQREAA